jgi:hypothetical protein
MHIDRQKLKALILGLVGLLGLMLLAGALPTLHFTDPFALNAHPGQVVEPFKPYTLNFIRITIIILLVVLSVGMLFMLLPSKTRRRLALFFGLLGLAIIIIAVATTQVRPPPLPPAPPTAAGVVAVVTAEPTSSAPPTATPSPNQAQPPLLKNSGLLVWLISLALAVTLLAVAALAWAAFSLRRPRPAFTFQEIAGEALQAIQDSGDVHSVIIRCYQQMLATAAAERGLERPEHLTPTEFTRHLISAGLPPDPVQRLTHLFESARYSPQAPTPEMEASAKACLTALAQAVPGGRA